MNIFRSYLDFWIFFIYFVLLFLFFALSQYLLFLVSLLIGFSIFFLFRKEKISISYNEINENKSIVSPVNGFIIKIEKNCKMDQFSGPMTKVQIVLPWWKSWGIFFPNHSSVIDICGDKNIFLFLGHNEISQIGLEFRFKLAPRLKVIPGDFGKRSVNIGYCPLGGVLNLYIPTDFDLFVAEGELVVGGVTLISSCKKNSEELKDE